ncbi:putative zinc-binding protein (Yippee) [Trypanosoma cruzi]|uniref:Uncharacterized protein n=1 Tax=Trypanosoma cruzi (strain CL Brener) TaxID=353153 RepID=Q4DX90_TRYCC|nr:hypothetical protein, conserved [Trypanosoma cruzi]EAN97123.1 hypothetical protein, conserved [Trypanosoma cruzi]RNC61238.1 putative zinc-binding protein (Yippee) [Trypanosoma cruzi]|eukprot:XP_818974.1 hypothetical protein [Trypanosoma cruzi strain CL Brener]
MGGSLRVLKEHLACDEGWGQTFWLRRRRKRRRVSNVGDDCGVTTVGMDEEGEEDRTMVDPEAQSLFRLRVVGTDGVASVPLFRSALCGPAVEDTYACHYHLYPSVSPGDAHGTALCWSLRRSSLKIHALMCLGRVANSCRKEIVLFYDDIGVLLSYTTTP